MLPALTISAALLAATVTAATAAPPAVVTDIAPVQSLVAAVMEGMATPAVLPPPGASPHDVALRPSEARAIAGAEAVFWIGPELSPGMARAVAAAPKSAVVTELLAVPGTRIAPLRALDPKAGHGPKGDGHDAEGAAHGVDEHDHGHGPQGGDPHAWLDPANARLWLRVIADTLSQADPENAAIYAANTAAADAAIVEAEADAAATLAPVRQRRAVVLHDAFASWEAAFGMPRPLAVAASDAARPGPAHLAALRAEVAAQGIACVLAEPTSDPKLAALVADAASARVGLWDDLGSTLRPGPALYPALLRALAAAYADCVRP